MIDTLAPATFGGSLRLLFVHTGARHDYDVAKFIDMHAPAFGFNDVDICFADVHDKQGCHYLIQRIYSGAFAGALIEPPATTWSRLRYVRGGPRPVRCKQHPGGFPWLEAPGRAECQLDNDIIQYSVDLCYALHSVRAFFVVIHPEDLGRTKEGDHPASIWQLDTIRKLAGETEAITAAAHQCDPEAAGQCLANLPKPTRLFGTAHAIGACRFVGWPAFDPAGWYLGPLPRACGHSHVRQITAAGHALRSAGTAMLPPAFSEWLAKLLLTATRSRPVRDGVVQALPKEVLGDTPRGGISGRIVGEGDFTNPVPPGVGKAGFTHGPVPLSQELAAKAAMLLGASSSSPLTVLEASGRGYGLGLATAEDGAFEISGNGPVHSEITGACNALIRQAVSRLAVPFGWTSLQVNVDSVGDWHRDPGMASAVIVGLGDFTGGTFEVAGSPPFDVAGRALWFNAEQLHRSLPFEGRRTTVVAFSRAGADKIPEGTALRLKELGFRPEAQPDSDTSDEDEDGQRRVRLQEALAGRPPPLSTRWAGKRKPFHDGAGLCSPFRWPPEDRPKTARDKFPGLLERLRDIVLQVASPSAAIFRLATGNGVHSPFTEEQVRAARSAVAEATGLSAELAERVVEHQPFHLHLLSAFLEKAGDPDWRQLTQGRFSFAVGVPIGVGIRMPRTPAVFERKTAWRALDDTVLETDRDNYRSAAVVLDQLEAQFREDEQAGMMFRCLETDLKEHYHGNRLRVAALGAIEKGPNSFRVVHDGTHGVRLNNEVRPRDQVRMPGPGEARCLLARAARTPGVHFALCADVSKAHRRFLNRREDWGLQACRIRPPHLWVNRVGTFGVGSACYWWARLAGLLARFVGAFADGEDLWQLLYSDDVHWKAHGPQKYRDLLMMLLLWELMGTPFSWKKCKGGVSTDWLGYWLDYSRFELGISESRGRWLADWLARAVERGASLVRELREGLGRLGFAAGVLEWHKPFLAPLYAWTAAAPQGAFLPHPPAVQLALLHLRDRFREGARTFSCNEKPAHGSRAFFADAKAEDGSVVLGGWEATPGAPTAACRWFSAEVKQEDAPWFFPGGRPSRTIAALELLATTMCVMLFRVPAEVAPARLLAKGVLHVTSAYTDNRGNSYAAAKLHSTKYPLSCVVMELATQLESQALWLDLLWTPREQNTLADKLTNGDFGDFDPALRVPVDFRTLQFRALPKLLEAGASLNKQLADLRVAKASVMLTARPKRQRQDALRVSDPW